MKYGADSCSRISRPERGVASSGGSLGSVGMSSSGRNSGIPPESVPELRIRAAAFDSLMIFFASRGLIPFQGIRAFPNHSPNPSMAHSRIDFEVSAARILSFCMSASGTLRTFSTAINGLYQMVGVVSMVISYQVVASFEFLWWWSCPSKAIEASRFC